MQPPICAAVIHATEMGSGDTWRVDLYRAERASCANLPQQRHVRDITQDHSEAIDATLRLRIFGSVREPVASAERVNAQLAETL